MTSSLPKKTAALVCLWVAAATAIMVLSPYLTLADEAALWPQRLRILYLPVVGKEATIKHFSPLTRHLEKTLGIPVEPVSFEDYQETLLYMVTTDFEMAYLSPAIYVEALSLGVKLEVVAMELDEEGRRGYYSYIICRSDSGLAKLEDGRGKSLAFADQKSTSGFLVPLHYFLNVLKVTPEAFAGKIEFVGDHQSVVKGVHEKKFELGAVSSMDFERTLQKEKLKSEDFTILWKSDLIPGSPVCVKQGLPTSLKAALIGALTMFAKDGEDAKALHIGGFAPATDRDYEVIRSLEGIR